MFRVVAEKLMFSLVLLGCSLSSASAQQVSLLDAARLQALQDQLPELVVLDVRSLEEYQAGHIAGAINVPFDEVPGGLAALDIDPSQPIVTYCRTGARAAVALQALHQAGFTKLGYLEGDFPGWAARGLPVAEGDCRYTVTAGASCECGTGKC